jgi:hypothetical protein
MRPIQFVSMTMVIQMKLLKVTCSVTNMTDQEFQLDMESKLIQVQNMKMRPIQFASLTMVIQMKLMKVIGNSQNTMIQEFSQILE